jgi:phosphate transport system permease protein
MLRSWPKVVSLSLALIPMSMLGFMVVTIVVRAAPAITDTHRGILQYQDPTGGGRGLSELFSTKFSSLALGGIAHYGFVPAVWGSAMVVTIAMALALPASLAIAICAGEFAPGLPARLMRAALGLMAGIPPIVYALMAIVFVAPFMVPKFTGGLNYTSVNPEKVGVSPEAWPPAGVPWNASAFPWDPTGRHSSVLLAAILLALLVIPYIAPMIEDAIRNVPVEPREASLALGASRWHTFMHITLRQSLAGIISATRLGALKVLGDVMIGLFVIGAVAGQLPNPLWDPLETTAPLTAEGVGLIGSFFGPGACRPSDCQAGYFTGALLLVMAFVIVVVTVVLERFARRKFAT